MTIPAATFRETLGHYPTGVAVVTAISVDGTPVGMVVGSFTSVSLDPPLVAFLPTKESGSWARLSTAQKWCVNVLAADQEDVCRQFASRIPDKFEGTSWTAAPGGSPILDGVVAWIECDPDQVVEGGDHWIVLGKVTDLGVRRRTLPLLFFQGGYGRFTPASLIAPGSPDVLHAVRVAETVRDRIDALASSYSVDCSVLTKVGSEAVFVLTADHSPNPERVSVGHRVPIVAPVGSVYLLDAEQDEVDRWLAGGIGQDEATVERLRANLATVRERGYSLSLAQESHEDERLSLVSDYSEHGLPEHMRRFRQLIADTAQLYEPEIVDGEKYSLHSIVVPVPTPGDTPPIALRMASLPANADAELVKRWIADLQATAHAASDQLGHLPA